MYSKSWLPGGMSIIGLRENIVTLLFSTSILFISFDILKFLKLQINLSSLENKFLYLLLFIVLIATVYFNPIEFTSIKSIINMLCYASLFIIYFFIFPKYLYKNPKYFEKFIKIIIIWGFIFAVVGFFMLFISFNPFSANTFALVSFINHPNNTSIVFTITFIPTLYYLLARWNALSIFSKLFYFFSFILQIVAQLFTYTRAGMIATAFGLIIFLAFYYRSKFIFILPILISIIPLFVVAFFKAKGFASFVSRFYLLIPAMEMIQKSTSRMLWGYGITNSLIEYKKNLLEFNTGELTINDPHNTYVTLVLMLGLIYSITLLIFIVLLIFKYIKKIIKSNDRKISLFYIFLVSSTISIMIQGLFDAELIKIDYFVIHYLLICFGMMYLFIKKNKDNKKLLSQLTL